MNYRSPVILFSSLIFWFQAQAADDVPGAKILSKLHLPPDEKAFTAVQQGYLSTTPVQTEAAADKGAAAVREFSLGHVGGNRLLAHIKFDQVPQLDDAKFIIYLDTDDNAATGRQDANAPGADLMVVVAQNTPTVLVHNEDLKKEPKPAAAICMDGKDLWVTIEMLMPAAKQFKMRGWVLSQRHGSSIATGTDAHFTLPAGNMAVAPLSEGTGYRYKNQFVKYETLENKGLTYEDIVPSNPMKRERPVPTPPFNVQPRALVANKQGAVEEQQVRVNILEEAGAARSLAHISFGFPFPEKAIFDSAHVRILDGKSVALAAQVTPTVRWPDGSLKWVLIDLLRPVAAHENSDLIVNFGSKVAANVSLPNVRLQQDASSITVITGLLKAVIDCKHFNVLRDVWIDRNKDGCFAEEERVAGCGADGIRLLDEKGVPFNSSEIPPDRVSIEESGSEKVVVRVDGRYGSATKPGKSYMRYVTRMTFLAGSPVVTVAHTHFDNFLETEFTDFTSLTMSVQLPSGISSVGLLTGSDQKLLQGPALSLFQSDENHAQATLEKEGTELGRCPGTIEIQSGKGAMTAALHSFWQRWPKAITAKGNEITFGFLPPQPSPQYGADLPYHLMFPFVSGKYRMKWGMSFTEKISFDFSGKSSPAELAAEANVPVIAVVPADWYADSQALGEMAKPMGKQFAQWDDYVAQSFKLHLQRRDEQREYGFFNFGDWFGERGRNWGDNEYDRAHCFFMQFARTGDRNLYRVALDAARHQADVDTVHDYPDPYYIGGNHQHSIGHTGVWEGPADPPQATWSAPYDMHTDAQNGHTWSSGMCDAWFMSGDARVMDAALEEAEHITWAMSPAFKELGTHERSAGWSLVAIMALYRATYDPAYLEGAKRIVAVALKEESWQDGGLWPHKLPLDHSGGVSGIIGNNNFLIGILLGGLKAYEDETGDPDVYAALDAGAKWMVKSFDKNTGEWPYSSSPAGKAIYTFPGGTRTLNSLIMSPVAYIGVANNDPAALAVAESALRSMVNVGGLNAMGKPLAETMFFTPETLGLLQKFYRRNNPAGGLSLLDGSDQDMLKFLSVAEEAKRQAVREPDKKTFFVRLIVPTCDLMICRTPVGAAPSRAPTASVKVFDSKGGLLLDKTCSTDLAAEFNVKLQGKAGDVYRVEINDDQRGAWNATGDGLQSIMLTRKGFGISSVAHARYSFFVPAGTEHFQVRLTGLHHGPFGAIIYDPEGRFVGMKMGTNTAGFLVGNTAIKNKPEEIIQVQPKAGMTGKGWSMILWAGGDEGIELQGIPPYLAASAKELFNPEESTSTH